MKSQYIAKKYWNAVPSSLGQKEDPSLLYKDLINFSLGDPDLNTDERVIEGAFNDALNGHTHYTESVGRLELREEIAKYHKERYDLEFSTDEIMVTTSGCHAMTLALQATLDPGDEVIVPTPYFSMYDDQILAAEGIPVYCPTYEEDDYQLDIKRLESLITNRTKGIIINTPCNPTGSCLSRKNLEEIAEIAKKYDLLIYADDIYTIYSYQEPFIPMCSIDGMRERTITIGSFSKDFCMTGWRIGYIIADTKFIDTAATVNNAMIYSAPAVSQQAAIHALRLRDEIQPALVKEFKERMFYGYERLNKLNNVKVFEPKGTFYLFPNIKGTGLTSAEVTKKLLEEAHILVVPGTAFGEAGEGYLRLACTLGVDKMAEAFDRMEKMDIFK